MVKAEVAVDCDKITEAETILEGKEKVLSHRRRGLWGDTGEESQKY